MYRQLTVILFSILVSCSPLRKYQDLPEVKAWENEIEKFEQYDRTETYPTMRFFLLAAQASCFGRPSAVIWRHTLSSSVDSEDRRLSDVAVYADRIVKPHPCRAIVLFVANDITGGDQDKSPEEVAALFKNVLKTIRKSHPRYSGFLDRSHPHFFTMEGLV